MSMFYLPADLRVRLGRLQGDQEFLELLRAIPEPSLPHFRPSHSEGAASDYQQQKDEWVFASGKREGFRLLAAYLGVKPNTVNQNLSNEGNDD